MREVELLIAVEGFARVRGAPLTEDAHREIHGKLVVPGRNRGVGGEDAPLPDRLQVVAVSDGAFLESEMLLEQLHREQARVALVHVKALHGVVTERPQQAHATDSEQRLLAEPVAIVATVETVGQAAILGRILGKVGVQEIDGDGVLGETLHLVSPGPQLNGAPLDAHGDSHRKLLGEVVDRPRHRLLALTSLRVEALVEVALAVEQAHRDHGHSSVGRGADGVAGQHTQAAAVGGNPRFESDLHREVGDGPVAAHVPFARFHVGDTIADRGQRKVGAGGFLVAID